MIVAEYAPLARRTLKELPFSQHLLHMGLGLTGEMGELLDAVKKIAVYGKEPDLVNIMEEVGDLLWYAANLLPDLMASPDVFEIALNEGWVKGDDRTEDYCEGPEGVFNLAADLLHMNTGMAATVTGGLLGDIEGLRPGGSKALQVVESLGGLIGTVAGLLGVDLSEAMDRNIAKLAKRYGDKFSDVAALNRDVAAERQVLEGREGA